MANRTRSTRPAALGGLAALAFVAGCNSSSEPPEAPPTERVAASAAASPVPTASDPDPTKAASLWLDQQTEPRQPGQYAPRDECGKLPGARAFRRHLATEAVKPGASAATFRAALALVADTDAQQMTAAA